MREFRLKRFAVFVVVMLTAGVNTSWSQAKPAPTPASTAPTITAPNNTTKIVAPFPLPDVSENAAENEKIAKQQAYDIGFQDFLKTENKVFILTGQLSAMLVKPRETFSEKDARKKSREIEDKLTEMIRFINGEKPKKTQPDRTTQPESTLQAVEEFTHAMAILQPDLVWLTKEQKMLVDLRLQQSVLEQLQKARTLAQRIAGE